MLRPETGRGPPLRPARLAGDGWFMESPLSFCACIGTMNTIRIGPRAVPARSGHARTRASVVFPRCRRGPRAATGDRSRSATSPRASRGRRLVHGKPLSFSRMHGDHEHVQSGSSRRESAQISPIKNERTDVRCYKVHETPAFVFRMYRDHEPAARETPQPAEHGDKHREAPGFRTSG